MLHATVMSFHYSIKSDQSLHKVERLPHLKPREQRGVGGCHLMEGRIKAEANVTGYIQRIITGQCPARRWCTEIEACAETQ